MEEGDGDATKGTMQMIRGSNVRRIFIGFQQEVQGTELIK
jgi:hypothetical protein